MITEIMATLDVQKFRKFREELFFLINFETRKNVINNFVYDNILPYVFGIITASLSSRFVDCSLEPLTISYDSIKLILVFSLYLMCCSAYICPSILI